MMNETYYAEYYPHSEYDKLLYELASNSAYGGLFDDAARIIKITEDDRSMAGSEFVITTFICANKDETKDDIIVTVNKSFHFVLLSIGYI